MEDDKFTLSDNQIMEFQMLYKKIFGEDINREKAFEAGLRLINLMRILCAQNG